MLLLSSLAIVEESLMSETLWDILTGPTRIIIDTVVGCPLVTLSTMSSAITTKFNNRARRLLLLQSWGCFFSVAFTGKRHSSRQLISGMARRYILRNSEAKFRRLRALKGAKEWLDQAFQRQKTPYLVVGAYTWFNTTLTTETGLKAHVSAHAKVPTGLAQSLVDASVGGEARVKRTQRLSYPGKVIFQLEYCEVKRVKENGVRTYKLGSMKTMQMKPPGARMAHFT